MLRDTIQLLRQNTGWLVSTLGVAMVGLLVCFGYFYYSFGSTFLAWNYMLGREMVAEFQVVASSSPAAPPQLSARIWNLSGQEVSVLGLEADCSCVLALPRPFPVAVAAGEFYSIPINGQTMVDAKGGASWTFLWYTTHPKSQVVPAVLTVDSSGQKI
jgi:hypothetical protein